MNNRIMSPKELAKRLSVERAYARALKRTAIMANADTMTTAWESIAGMPMRTPSDWHGMVDPRETIAE